ncbi:hypothetical protein [Limobrevibacterium gyesilva]|uniref:Uncharacterized protein n=1 Tax=Limobrevibacterium gyesilva TaxID=2991712 RepID=A0AA41YK12_9PROT|nr:hypothetical protein [Limobrevibacterium gyesilva]MCW3474669.1 hypothetical protein [Limobrevibacterium gyesilva]
MPETPGPALSVAALLAERDARRLREREAEDQLKRKQQEELAEFKKRLDSFQLTDTHIQIVLDRIKRAFERGETELMLTSFPSEFCTDKARAIINADAPPINKPDKAEQTDRSREPEWLATLPAGARPIYEYWKSHLQPGGFGFSARIINYKGGMPGDIGLFFSWPKSAMEAQP